jgi:cell division transport system ATP-binding protein
VFENVAFALEVIGRPYSEIRKRVEQILNEVGLTACMRQLPTSLSGGEQQRVAIARALVRDPWLLLADEPTGNLDYSMAEEILAMFERANQRGTTIMIATHAQDLIAKQKHIYRLVHLENACFADTTADPYAVEFSTPMILEHHSSITHRAE